MTHDTLRAFAVDWFPTFDILGLYHYRFRKPSNYIIWQGIVRRESVKLGGNLEDIFNFADVHRISINLLPANLCFFGIPISRTYLFHQIYIPSIDPALSSSSFSNSSIVVHQISPARCNRLKFKIILTANNTMWQFKSSAFPFCPGISILYGFILSL